MGTAQTLFEVYEDATVFWRAVHVLCLAHKGTVTAGMRSKKENDARGHTAESLHCRGLAAHVVFDTAEDEKNALQTAREMRLHPRKSGNHLHLQPFAEGRQFKRE